MAAEVIHWHSSMLSSFGKPEYGTGEWIVTIENQNRSDRDFDILMVMPRTAFPYAPDLQEALQLENPDEDSWIIMEEKEPQVTLSLVEAEDYGITRKALSAEWTEAGKKQPLSKRQQMLHAALAKAAARYRETPGKYPLYIRLSAQDLEMIAMLSRLRLIPYFGEWSMADQARSEADWQIVTDALREASTAGLL